MDAAEIEAAFVIRLGEKIAERCSKRPRQDEGRPKQQSVGHLCEEVGNGHHRKGSGKDDRPPFVPES